MAIEFARHVLGYSDATSAEFDPTNLSSHHIIHIMEDQKTITTKGGTMRLGGYDCVLKKGSKISTIYGNESVISERHRHRYEFNNTYRQAFEDAGFCISGTSPDGSLVEMVELTDHPYMVATQAHPELKSRPTNPHPLMMGFVEACCHI
jgi:CTP synthase